MNDPIAQFRRTFLEESFEALDSMEAALLGLSGAEPDPETVHALFRSAHSLKGGAGSFGFAPVGDFMHVVETLLDQVRSGGRAFSAELASALLRSVDSAREM